MKSIKTVKPVQCHLWRAKIIETADLEALIRIRLFVEYGHDIRALLECERCGQLYYYEFFEEIDWVNEDDLQCQTYIPIENDEETIETLNGMDMEELLSVTPRLQVDWWEDEPDEPDKAVWVGYDEEPQHTQLVERAYRLAVKWHEGQTRKGDGLPYISHPISVAVLLGKNNFSAETIAAGFCHDLLEDTQCTEEEIAAECGAKVLEIIKAVTNDESKDWESKKLAYIESVRNGPVEAKAVCAADKICNLRTLVRAYHAQGPNIWKKFNRGKEKKLWFERQVLAMLKETWGHPLTGEYEKMLTVMAGLDGG